MNSDGNETGVTVNGIVASVYGNEFVANHVPLVDGTNTITVNATDIAGHTATAVSITVTSIASNYIALSTNIDSGTSVLEPTLRIEGYKNSTTPDLSFTGPGSVDSTNCISFDACKLKLTTEGIYYFTTTATGIDGNTYQDTIGVVVVSRAEMDAWFQAKWQGMKSALAQPNPDIEGAISYFAEISKNSYRQEFTSVSGQLQQLVADMGQFEMVKVRDHLAEYDMRSFVDGEEYSFMVLFMKDIDGIWRIRDF